MKNLVFLFLSFFMAPLMGLSQSNSVMAKWNPENKVILQNYDGATQSVLLPNNNYKSQEFSSLEELCKRMSTDFLHWSLDADNKNFVIKLNKSDYPDWSQIQWERHINRTVGYYFKNQ